MMTAVTMTTASADGQRGLPGAAYTLLPTSASIIPAQAQEMSLLLPQEEMSTKTEPPLPSSHGGEAAEQD